MKIYYKPPPTIRDFIVDHRVGELFYDWIIGPVGSGKTTGLFFKLVRMAGLQARGPDGIRRTRAVIVRNTMPQLRDTTLSSWSYWFKDGQAGEWIARDNKFVLRFNDIECEVLFRPLDTPDDVARVLSLEVTFAILDEFVELPREIVDALSARCGRYPSAMEGGATNWGMWGSSNPSTEDNWWFDYLHAQLPENAIYFKQPSGMAENAENVENLPGARAYYTSQAKGKAIAWIKQFIEAEWGFSISGQPVVPAFHADLHIAKNSLGYDPLLPVVIGMDPGLTGSALIFGQQLPSGRLNVLGELVQSGMGAKRIISERLKPYVASRFPDAHVVIAPDPAANNRSPSDERTVIDEFKRHFEVKIETNNRLPLRLDAIEHFASRLVEGAPALQIDPKNCPLLVRALKGGWRYGIATTKAASGTLKGTEPEKNQYSHPGDAFGYLCRFFHRQAERDIRSGVQSGGRKFVPPRFASTYHFR